MGRLIILIEDDWELKGNGAGNIAQLQYIPSIFLLDIAHKFGFKVTFMVETLQQFAFLENSDKDRNIKIQANLWEDNVKLMIEGKHDVQLHIHPQWYHVLYREGYFELNDKWNIATYDSQAQLDMIKSSMEYLNTLIKPLNPFYRIETFKAGSWALQPSEVILNNLADNGIRIVIGVGKGIKYVNKDFFVDYTMIEEDTQPYYPDFSDITKVSDRKERLFIIPLPFYKLRINRFLARAKRNFFSLIVPPFNPKEFFYSPGIHKPSVIVPQIPGVIKRMKQSFNVKSFDIGDADFEDLKSGIDQIIYKALKIEREIVPIVLQSHTKAYLGNLSSIERFFGYLTEKYSNHITFMTFSEFLQKSDNIQIKLRGN